MPTIPSEDAATENPDGAATALSTHHPRRKLFHFLVRLLISAALLLPCFWHRHIQAGDLGSHTYNAWLAQLIHQGKAPGLYLAAQYQNVFFDYLLFYLCRLFGFTFGEKLAVSVCVLIFFWGVFAFLRAATGRAPWFLVPVLAMASYCYVFHMGFMNYYLSIGLASFGLALIWEGKSTGIAKVVLLTPFIVLAHPLGILWMLGVAVYRFASLHLNARLRFALPVLVMAFLASIRWYLRHPLKYSADWADPPFYQWNGLDQFRIFGSAYDRLALFLAFLGILFILMEVYRHGREIQFWKRRHLLLELYLVSFSAVICLPEDLRLQPEGSWIGSLATRLTLICVIFALAFLASLSPRIWHLIGFGVCAVIFFFLLHRDTGVLDRLEQNAEAITHALPFGTRVSSTVFSPPGFRPQYEHLVDRACINHCFLYSNYEPSTEKFRVRVDKQGSPLVASAVDESEDLQFGNYDIEDGDLPMKQIYQCDSNDLTKLCIRDLESGEKNGRLGYRP